MRRLYCASGPPKSRPSASNDAGASRHADAGMLRSRWGRGGRSSVSTGVPSIGRWSYGRAINVLSSSMSATDVNEVTWDLSHLLEGREDAETAVFELLDQADAEADTLAEVR